MKSRNTNTAVLVAVVIGLLVAAAGPAAAKEEKREPIEKFRARAVSLDRGAAKSLDIVIYEWTTPEERQALFQTLVEKGSKALYDALGDQSAKGYLRAPRSLAYDMQYAWQFEAEGRRHIVLATDRPLGFLRARSNDISLVVLDLDPETGEGEGDAVAGAELSIDKETGRLKIGIPGTQPTRLTSVKPLPMKKE
jgi:hypothetical protein